MLKHYPFKLFLGVIGITLLLVIVFAHRVSVPAFDRAQWLAAKNKSGQLRARQEMMLSLKQKIVISKTTKEEIRQLLGKPDSEYLGQFQYDIGDFMYLELTFDNDSKIIKMEEKSVT